ncbi:MAG: tRNA (5-methylaminomethyl-2-thiouridine)(34)-methyltransferase MnmD [Pseudomonadota bacterium]
MRLPPRPDLIWKDDGTPVDRRVDDVYYSVEDGLAETRAVFLAGCGLPDAWKNRASFTIAELGFGTGLNFLATWQMWQATRGAQGWLHFVSFEGYPLDAEDIARALKPWPELTPLAERLCERWPPRAKGVRQIIWPEERLTLTLHIGLIGDTLPQSEFYADAWFLDGFSPAKNQAMWEDHLWSLIAERSNAMARAATFTVAGAVRRGLASAGFQVEKRPGHGRKRERLEAQLDAPVAAAPKPFPTNPRVAIVGAGIAGACLAYALSQRGADVTIWETDDGPARGTSGNPLALVMPRLDAADTAQARLLLDAYLSAQGFYQGRPGVTVTETVHRPRNASEAERFEKLLADPPLGLEQLEALSGGGLLHKGALAIEPNLLLPHLLEGAHVKWSTRAQIAPDRRAVNDEAFDAIILASGWHMARYLPDLDLTGRLGQIEWVSSNVDAPASALAAGTYALAIRQTRLWGATFADHEGGAPQTSDAARDDNLQALEELAPYWWHEAKTDGAHSRAGVRATTADRLPLIGAWPNPKAMAADRQSLERLAWRIAPEAYAWPGCYIAGGFGSRGFTWAPWAASIIRSLIFKDPSPAQFESQRASVPNRQILRILKRNPAK